MSAPPNEFAMNRSGRRRKRVALAGAAAAATVVAGIFTFVGDGVDVPAATGVRRFVVDVGHGCVWGLLAMAFGIAALRGRWTRPSQVIAVASGVVYGVFLLAVFAWR